MNPTFKKSMAYVLILGQVAFPVPRAFAEDKEDPFAKFHRVCDETLKQIKAGTLKTAGDTQAGYCANAEIWRQTYNAEKGKSIGFGAATSALLGMSGTQMVMKRLGMHTAIGKAQIAAGSADANLTNATGWSTSAATQETEAYALDAAAAAAAASVVGAAGAAALEAKAIAAHTLSYQSAATAVESAVSAAEFAKEASRSLDQVKKLEDGIKKMASVCKKSTGAAVAAQLLVDLSVTGHLNKVREEYDLAKDNMGYITALGQGLSQGVAAIGGTAILESIGQQSTNTNLESKLSEADVSMAKTEANLKEAQALAASVKTAANTASAGSKSAAGMVSATAIGVAAVTASTAAVAAAKAAIAAAEAIKAQSEGGKSCLTNSFGMGLMTTTSASQMIGAKNQFTSNTDQAGTIKQDSALSTGNFLNAGLTQANNANNAVNAPNHSAEITSEGCLKASDIQCLGSHDAVMAAITSSPEFMGEMSKAMGGDSLASVIDGFKGNTPSDLSNYVAQKSGNSALVSAALNSADKIAKESKFAEKFKASGYVSANRKIASKDDDFDMNKMMNGLMSKFGTGDQKKDGKPGETDYVFRQLELMTPQQIQENKGISLFSRVAYRYRKKNADLEQMTSTRTVEREVSSQKK